ncbi:hypothetical protein [Acinetobacter gyllenbergii]|uniref:hypothetical protein n=1 Tax=Acinetobacter gyllenbergii TaxID=134534 RepID=UPI001E2AA079|nr:hypothetical protein [Acinetobacter gyllenbergii]
MEEFNNEKGYQKIAHSPDEQNCSSVHSESDQIESQSALHLSIVDKGGAKEDCKTNDLAIAGGENQVDILTCIGDTTEIVKNAEQDIPQPRVIQKELRGLHHLFKVRGGEFLFLTEQTFSVLFCWSVLTRFLSLYDEINAKDLYFAPILMINASGPGYGKSTLQMFLAWVNGVNANERVANATPAGLVRMTSSSRGHPVFADEVDVLKNVKDFTEYFNSGFERDGPVTARAKASKSVFGFKCVSGINIVEKLEVATVSRCIVIEMQKVPNGVNLKKYKYVETADLVSLSHAMDEVIKDYYDEILEFIQTLNVPLIEYIDDRLGDVWEDLLKISILLGEDVYNDVTNFMFQSGLVKDKILEIASIDFTKVEYPIPREKHIPDELVAFDVKDKTTWGNVPTKVFVKACGDYLVTSDDLRRGIRSIELERFQEKLKLAGVPITSRLITRAFNAETGVPVVDKNVDGSSGYLFTTLDSINLTPTEHRIYEGIIHLLKEKQPL